MATPASAIVPPNTITGVSGLPNTMLDATTPITGAPSVTGMTVVTGWRCNSHAIPPEPIKVEPSAEKAIHPNAAVGIAFSDGKLSVRLPALTGVVVQ